MLLLLPALMEAQQAVPCRGPMSAAQLTQLVKGSVPEERIEQLVASCGIGFEPTTGAIGRLRAAGMPETVLDAVRAATGPAARKRQAERAFWKSIKDSRDTTVFEDYLRRYPDGQFADAARQRRRDLKVTGVRVEMERTLAAGQWDAADATIRDLLQVVPENDEIRGWERRVADGREADRKQKADAAVWESIKDRVDPAVFEGYLRRNPEERFAAVARQRYGDLKVVGMRVEMERTLGAGQWDAADAKIRDLLRVAPDNDEIRGWQRRVADGREAERKRKAGQTLWESVKDSRDPQVFERFLGESPASQYAGAARLKLEAMAGTKKVNPKDGLTYVWIPPGRFMMGCSPGDAECNGDERPAHEVTIARGFWLGQTPVTQQAYRRVTGQSPSHFKGANLPVETVSWNEAKAYCAAIGGRLPTEAEWEYAARAGSVGARYGDLGEIGWYLGNSGGQTHEVGQKAANAFGLYDMLGNLWQWVADWYGSYQPGAENDPAGAGSGQSKVTRGGAWNGLASGVRASFRGGALPGSRNLVIGLRCVGE